VELRTNDNQRQIAMWVVSDTDDAVSPIKTASQVGIASAFIPKVILSTSNTFAG
jgi:hypothetical protein